MWFHRVAGAGLTGGLSTFLVGAMAAGAVLSLIKQQEPRISQAVRGRSSSEDMTLEELIAEKERLEDLIAEAAAKHANRG
jgi:hypothetical protein